MQSGLSCGMKQLNVEVDVNTWSFDKHAKKK
jgi:hypothetical protein